MKKNTMKEKLARGEAVIGFTVLGNWPEMVEILGLLGADYVWLDGEHGPLGLPEMAGLVRAAECVGITPLARVPRNAPDVILGYLDAGVQGIIVPMVQTREEAEAVVRAVKYYPEGKRGIGYGHAQDYYLKQPLAEYIKEANRETAVICQCETKEGLDNLEEIVQVPGVDIIMIGPMDLSQSLGIPGQYDHPLEEEAIAQAKRTIINSGKEVGLIGWDAEYARKLIAEGVRFINKGAHSLLVNAAKEYLKESRGEE